MALRSTVVGTGDRHRRHAHRHPNIPEPVAGGAGAVLWEWNGVDLTQFDGAAAFNSPGWAATLSVVAEPNSIHGNKIRMGSAVGVGDGASVWLVTDPIVFPTVFRRIVIEATVLTPNPVSGYRGWAFCADPGGGGLHALLDVHTNGSGWQSRIDAGTGVFSGSTIGASLMHQLAQEHQIKVETHLRKPAGAAPDGIVSGDSRSNQAITGRTWRIADPGWAAFPASWNALDCDRWGLAIQASGLNPAPTDYDLTSLLIRGYDF